MVIVGTQLEWLLDPAAVGSLWLPEIGAMGPVDNSSSSNSSRRSSSCSRSSSTTIVVVVVLAMGPVDNRGNSPQLFA